MCNCIMIGDIKIIDGIVFVGDKELIGLPNDLLDKLRKGDFKCTIHKGKLFLEEYEYKDGEFKKTLKAWIRYRI